MYLEQKLECVALRLRRFGFWFYSTNRLVGRQVQFLEFFDAERSNPRLQARLRDRAHLKRESYRVDNKSAF
jgi:hypothetical protein